MRNKILVSIMLLELLVTSCAAMKEVPEKISGEPGTAVITESYAQLLGAFININGREKGSRNYPGASNNIIRFGTL